MSSKYLSAAAIMMVLAACGPANDTGEDVLATGAMEVFEHAEAPVTLPEIMLANADGEKQPLKADLARVTLVNLWATWCAPCIVEMPALDALQADYDPSDFRIVTISLDRTPEMALDFFEDNALGNLTFRYDGGFQSASVFGAAGLPISVLLDSEGREIGRVNGPAEWDTPEARALIDAALAQS